jgi:hypothetical protein
LGSRRLAFLLWSSALGAARDCSVDYSFEQKAEEATLLCSSGSISAWTGANAITSSFRHPSNPKHSAFDSFSSLAARFFIVSPFRQSLRVQNRADKAQISNPRPNSNPIYSISRISLLARVLFPKPILPLRLGPMETEINFMRSSPIKNIWDSAPYVIRAPTWILKYSTYMNLKAQQLCDICFKIYAWHMSHKGLGLIYFV